MSKTSQKLSTIECSNWHTDWQWLVGSIDCETAFLRLSFLVFFYLFWFLLKVWRKFMSYISQQLFKIEFQIWYACVQWHDFSGLWNSQLAFIFACICSFFSFCMSLISYQLFKVECSNEMYALSLASCVVGLRAILLRTISILLYYTCIPDRRRLPVTSTSSLLQFVGRPCYTLPILLE